MRVGPESLYIIGLISSFYGLRLLWKAITGDTMAPGGTFTYWPRWIFIVGAVVLQIPLLFAFWFNHAIS